MDQAPTQPLLDHLHRFLFEDYDVRGELVQLSQSYQDVLRNHNYPAAIERLVGELFVATSLLTATLKFEGHINVQLQGDGPVHLAAINGDHNQALRGVARYKSTPADDANLTEMVGKGFLLITITPNEGERYQGVVELVGNSLTDSLENYFAQSEQLATKLILKTGLYNDQKMAAGLLLQKLPTAKEEHEAEFSHVTTLAETLKDDELFGLDAETLLYRLYHQEAVRIFEPQAIVFECGCSREKCEGALLSVEKSELLDILQEKGQIDMDCEYCRTAYHFDALDVEALFATNNPSLQNNKTKH
ncbi:Hsp33 family molecular chaperone HslO [Motilimonas sp. 1_MG-2023]|uniref:Hsp33 family molecular chaperone HslO n=1 Tax=Motilimonas TaxID=1914248 RepID=UPI0026E25A8E|nr:Hsp33 family molecular chaperone HslO [Motilimonas sp. 1_MG-2023]MDO6527350.1 Hsp33 family molecular chaperone HslO [Motilimonas sp. 1_MG-2023]